MLHLVALDAGDSLFGHAALYPELLRLGLILSVSQGHQAAPHEKAGQPYDQNPNNKMPFHFSTPFPSQLLIDY
jgi:hypothetical protein